MAPQGAILLVRGYRRRHVAPQVYFPSNQPAREYGMIRLAGVVIPSWPIYFLCIGLSSICVTASLPRVAVVRDSVGRAQAGASNRQSSVTVCRDDRR